MYASYTLENPHRLLVSRHGEPRRWLGPGRHRLWGTGWTVAPVDLTALRQTLSPTWAELAPPGEVREVVVTPFQRSLVYVDGELQHVLEAGRYVLSCLDRQVGVVTIDTREQELKVSGQEVMSADMVTLRLNLVVRYRVVDPVVLVHAANDASALLYTQAQVSARRVVAGSRLERLLSERNAASAEMLAAMVEVAPAWGVEVLALELKDLVLPGELKSILNQVLEAEKRAEANKVARREETAAMRSAANTARLLEANPTLMRLRELEALKELAGEVGSVTLVAGSELGGKLGLFT